MSGWVRIDRELFDHTLFPNEPMSEREAWVWMIARAAWEDTTHRVGQTMHTVPRGSFMTTLREMQSAFMWRSDTKVRNFLKRLEAEGMIERTTVGTRNAPKTHVTICNYEQFQRPERTENAPKTHRERTKNAVKEQDNNKQTSEPKGSSGAKRGSRLSQDWVLPRDWGEWALSEQWTEEVIRSEAEKFKDYWIAKTGKDATKADWFATWRNWMRNSKTPRVVAGGGASHGQRSVTERLEARFGEMDFWEGRDSSEPLFQTDAGRGDGGGGDDGLDCSPPRLFAVPN